AGVAPREIDTFVTVAEDFHEGTSITDEYTPDQLGAVRRPVQTIAGDGLQGLATAYMLIRSGLAATAVVEAHSKASNIVYHEQILALALDPTFERPWRVNPHAVAGLEMRRYLHEGGVAPEVPAQVVSKNRRAALANPFAAYGADLGVAEVLASEPLAEPLRDLEVSRYADGAVVLVLASADRAATRESRAVWIRGIGWATDEPSLSGRPWAQAVYARLACEAAYGRAGIRSPADEIDLFELDDTYAYKELQHLEAALHLGVGEGARLTAAGRTAAGGDLPVNVSGGNLGMGYGYDASALFRTAAAAHQVRGTAGTAQLEEVRTALVVSWRGVPTTTGGAVILGAA
ncbi:MAG: acetyl-CoA acetyltransferase, partial [Armatimonadetes bacterium]|nr:acetyl-CoA acetyltransferase [Armatimonadota bacterium]